MDQNQVENIEKQLLIDIGTCFRGTARILFDHFSFRDASLGDLDGLLKPKAKAIACMKEKFSTEGCLRMLPQNRIPAIIDQETLNSALRASANMSLDSLLENPRDVPPELKLPNKAIIECLKGLHRVTAAKEFLPRKDWWWVIDLYVDGKEVKFLSTIFRNNENNLY